MIILGVSAGLVGGALGGWTGYGRWFLYTDSPALVVTADLLRSHGSCDGLPSNG
jgi:hypothetical protein